MTQTYVARGGETEADLLAFLADAAGRGDDASVPAALLPVLTRHAHCRPNGDGCFLFRCPSAAPRPCGWGERLAAAALLVLAAPALALVAISVRVLEGSPVIFRQERFGVKGRPFRVYKFRTMFRRSEDLHARLQQARGQEGRLFKLERDPRVTRLGAVLRRSFLDELPQLLNVARGEMRFIGPRPLPASDQAHYTQPYHALRLEGVPGITGLWQVSGRNARTFDEMCLLDYFYLCNRTVRLDLRILGLTARTVLEEIGLKRKPQGGGQ